MSTDDKKEARGSSSGREERARELQTKLLQGELSPADFERELHKLGTSQFPSEPLLSASASAIPLTASRKIETTPPVSAEHLRFGQSHESMPQTGTNHTQYIHRTGSQASPSNIDNLSFDDLPVEPAPHTRPRPFPSLGKHTPGSRHSLETLPHPLVPHEPSTWKPGHLLDQRFQIERMLCQQSDEATFCALDLFLQEQVIIHLAAPSVAKTPGYRLGFAKRYLPMRDFLHPQVCRLYYIEYRHDEGLLYAVAAHHYGSTLEEQLEQEGTPQLSAAGGESLLRQLASILKQYRSQTGLYVAPQLNDIMWHMAKPQSTALLLRLRPPGPEQVKSPSCEVVATARLLQALLAGTQQPKEPLTKCNPTVSSRIEAVLEQAVRSPEQQGYDDLEALHLAYRQALLPHLAPQPPMPYQPNPAAKLPNLTPLPSKHEAHKPSASERPTDETLQTLLPSQIVHAHVADILSVSVDATGKILLTTGKDQQIKWWETNQWRLSYAETVARSSLNHARISPCSRMVAYSKSSHRVSIVRAGDLNSLCTLQHNSPVISLMWQPSAMGLLTMTRDNQLHHWRIPSGQIINSITQPDSLTDLIAQARINPDERLLTTLHKRGKIRFWSLDAHRWLFDLPDAVSPASAITYLSASFLNNTSNDSLLLTGHHDGKLRMWDYQTGVLHHKESAHHAPIISLEESPDGRHLASLDADNHLRLWELKPDKQIEQLCALILPEPSTRQGQQHTLLDCTFLTNDGGTQLVARSKGATFYVWNVPAEYRSERDDRVYDTQDD